MNQEMQLIAAIQNAVRELFNTTQDKVILKVQKDLLQAVDTCLDSKIEKLAHETSWKK